MPAGAPLTTLGTTHHQRPLSQPLTHTQCRSLFWSPHRSELIMNPIASLPNEVLIRILIHLRCRSVANLEEAGAVDSFRLWALYTQFFVKHLPNCLTTAMYVHVKSLGPAARPKDLKLIVGISIKVARLQRVLDILRLEALNDHADRFSEGCAYHDAAVEDAESDDLGDSLTCATEMIGLIIYFDHKQELVRRLLSLNSLFPPSHAVVDLHRPLQFDATLPVKQCRVQRLFLGDYKVAEQINGFSREAYQLLLSFDQYILPAKIDLMRVKLSDLLEQMGWDKNSDTFQDQLAVQSLDLSSIFRGTRWDRHWPVRWFHEKLTDFIKKELSRDNYRYIL